VKLLYLTPEAPAPADQGARIRSLALIRAAAEHHDVDLLSFHSPSNPVDVAALESVCREVRLVDTPGPRSLLARTFSVLLGVDPLPDLVHRFTSQQLDLQLAELLAASRYDIAVFEGLEMMGYHGTVRAGSPQTRIVYDAHNAETSLQQTMFRTEARDPRRWHTMLYSLTQWSKLSSYERIMLNSADLVLAVSDADAAKLRGRRADPRVVPNGIDTDAFAFKAPDSSPGRTIFFVGPLDYRPNADAVRWLVSQILPRLRARIPGARLRLVGRGSERIQADGVDALGYVADADAELRRADALIVPMRMGSGTRFKVLEAMAAGIPVVSTPLGLAGIAAQPNTHALVETGADDLAGAAARILEDRALARGMAQAARSLIEKHYAWKRITPGYLRLLREIARRRS
jgi:glycosyltransferase involved in cell wall biosynthesis